MIIHPSMARMNCKFTAGCLGFLVPYNPSAQPVAPAQTPASTVNYSIPLSNLFGVSNVPIAGLSGEESSKPSGMVRELAEALIAEFDYCGIPGGYASIHRAVEALRAELEK
jgi:hypothetical protein